jgi:hypothetical protein
MFRSRERRESWLVQSLSIVPVTAINYYPLSCANRRLGQEALNHARKLCVSESTEIKMSFFGGVHQRVSCCQPCGRLRDWCRLTCRSEARICRQWTCTLRLFQRMQLVRAVKPFAVDLDSPPDRDGAMGTSTAAAYVFLPLGIPSCRQNSTRCSPVDSATGTSIWTPGSGPGIECPLAGYIGSPKLASSLALCLTWAALSIV